MPIRNGVRSLPSDNRQSKNKFCFLSLSRNYRTAWLPITPPSRTPLIARIQDQVGKRLVQPALGKGLQLPVQLLDYEVAAGVSPARRG